MGNFVLGILSVALLFALSFAAIYITRIVYLLFLHIKPQESAAQENIKPKRENPQKIYYLVERKRAPVKKTASKPKRIYFSESSEV